MISPPAILPDFILVDQFKREIHHDAYRGSPLIVLAGNREGARGVALWTAALRRVVEDTSRVGVLPVADLGRVPKMMRGMIAKMLPREPAAWCALDWDQQLGNHIRRDHGPLVAAAFGTDRGLRFWTVLPLERVESATMVMLVERAESVS